MCVIPSFLIVTSNFLYGQGIGWLEGGGWESGLEAAFT
jgi:hypothetical protein